MDDSDLGIINISPPTLVHLNPEVVQLPCETPSWSDTQGLQALGAVLGGTYTVGAVAKLGPGPSVLHFTLGRFPSGGS